MSFLFVYVGKCLVLTAGCSPTRFTLAAGQVPHHIQARITDQRKLSATERGVEAQLPAGR